MSSEQRAARLRLMAFGLTLAVVFAAVALAVPHSADEIRAPVDELGAAGPLAFVVVATALTLALFPFPLIAAASGLLFGTAWGTLVSVIAGAAGGAAAFAVARRFGAGSVEIVAAGRVRRLLDAIGRRGFLAVLYLRIAPGIPRDIVNYAAGLAPIGFVAFMLATLLGTAPRAFAYTALGSSFAVGRLDSPEAIVAVSLLAAMALAGALLLWHEHRRRYRRPHE